MKALARRLIRFAIVVLCIANLVGLGLYVVMRQRSSVYRDRESFPIPSGYQIDNSYIDEGASKCTVVRVTADACPYCRRDRQEFLRLAVRAQKEGCRVVTIAPKVGDMALRQGESIIQLQFVDMQFGRVLNPFFTPQTIVLDRAGKLIWDKQGSMASDDVADAVNRLSGLSAGAAAREANQVARLEGTK